MAMSTTHVAVASRDAIYLWQFTTARSLGLSHLDKISNREKLVYKSLDKLFKSFAIFINMFIVQNYF